MEDFKEVVLIKEVIEPLLIIGISFIIYVLISKTIKHFYSKPTKRWNQKKKKTFLAVLKSVSKYVIIAIDIILLLNVYGIDTKGIVASFGVIGAVLGLAMQDFLKDIIAGLSILFEDQFRVGDWIQVGTFKGEVTYLGLKTTKIKAYTGETKIISNRTLTEVTNFNMQNSMAIVDVPVAYESDLKKVERVLYALCIDQQDKIPVLKGKIELLGIQELADSGVVYRVVAPCKAMEHIGVERILRKAIKVAFDKNHIKIPYPQVEVHNEGV